MSLEEGFWQDILAHPGDDTPRLVYADWLEENGDEARAEFIRAQIELETAEDGPRRWLLEQRTADLLRRHRASWLGGLRELVRGERFRRGFVDEVTLPIDQLAERIGRIVEEAPVRRVLLTAGSDEASPDALRQLARSPHLAQVVGLELHGLSSVEAARALLHSPHLGQLRELELACPEVTAEAMLALVQSPVCPRLRHLRLRARMPIEAWQVLTGSPALGRLESLALNYGQVPPGAVEALAGSAHLVGVRRLDLSHNHLSPEQMAALGAGQSLALEELCLEGNQLGLAGVLAWSDAATVASLRRLDLAGNRIDGAGIRALAGCQALRRLRRLDLRRNVAGSSLGTLALSENLGRLEVLLLHFNGVPDDGVETLADSPAMRGLSWLDLTANRLTGLAARALVDSAVLDRLVRLQLERNEIGADEREALRTRFGVGVTL